MVGRGRRKAAARHRRPLVVLSERSALIESLSRRCGASGSKPAQMAVPTEWANGSDERLGAARVPEGQVAATGAPTRGNVGGRE